MIAIHRFATIASIVMLLIIIFGLAGCSSTATVQNYADPAIRDKYRLKMTKTEQAGADYLRKLRSKTKPICCVAVIIIPK